MLVALTLFAFMALNYGLNTISIRLTAQGRYVALAVTDGLIALFGFFMIQEVAHSQTLLPCVGYVGGGVTGSLIGLWLSKRLERYS